MKAGDSIGVFKVGKEVRVFVISENIEMMETGEIAIPKTLNHQDHQEVENFLKEALAKHRLWPEAEGPYLWQLTSIPPLT